MNYQKTIRIIIKNCNRADIFKQDIIYEKPKYFIKFKLIYKYQIKADNNNPVYKEKKTVIYSI